MSAPNLPNMEALMAMGINPKTGLPFKMDAITTSGLKADTLKQLRIMDEQDHVNRGVWHNAPRGLTSQMMERIIYYRGQGIFFYMKSTGKFMFLPFALDGQIDVYGRMGGCTPVPMGSNMLDTADKKQKPWIPGLVFKPQYDIVLPNGLTEDMMYDSCVIISDYTPQANAQNVIPRANLVDSLLNAMSDCLPYLGTALLNSTGINAVRVGGEDEQSNVAVAAASMKNSALNQVPWIPIVGNLEWQNLGTNSTGKSEEFLLAMQGLDNYRLSTLGLSTGGLFQKKSHMLEAEQNMNAGNTGLILDDGVTLRQHACDVINSIWGLGMWYEPSETVIGVDRNNDMMLQADNSVAEEQQYMDGGESDETME